MIVGAARRDQGVTAMALAQIFDDRARFLDHPSIVLEQRRFAERMDGFQLGWREIGHGVALIVADFVWSADFLKQPQYALRAAVVQMVDDQAHRILLLSAPISVTIDQRRQLAQR